MATAKTPSPRFENGRPLHIAGLSEHHAGPSEIPAQWQRFMPNFGNIPGEVPDAAYGLIGRYDSAGGFDYVAGVEVKSADNLPSSLWHGRLPATRYAVFPHQGHVSKIGETIQSIMAGWLPKSGETMSKSTPFAVFERYGKAFDPQTGLGGMEVWVALEPQKKPS